jgi:hypothetical protein
MATTTTATKPAAKKAATRKPAAKKAATRKPAAAKTAAAKTAPAMPAAADITERIEEAFEDAVKFMRDTTHTWMGMGTVVQRQLINRDATDQLTVESFLQDAKAKGELLETEIRDRIEPIAKRIADRIEPITHRVEANLPTQVQEVLETGRERVRTLLAV